MFVEFAGMLESFYKGTVSIPGEAIVSAFPSYMFHKIINEGG